MKPDTYSPCSFEAYLESIERGKALDLKLSKDIKAFKFNHQETIRSICRR